MNEDKSFVEDFSATEIRIIQFILASHYTDSEIIEKLGVTARLIEDTRTKAISSLGGYVHWY